MKAPFSLLYGPQSFQTFVDDKSVRGLTPRQMHGTLAQWADALQLENNRSAGIYYTVNLTREALRVYQAGESTTVNARKAEDIVEVRAWYTDIDGISDLRQKRAVIRQLLEHRTPPSCIIQTKNGVHALWYAMPGTLPDLDGYRQTEEGIIHYWGGDPGVKDLARVLRLPGFWHKKDPSSPFMVTVEYENPELYYEEATIRAAFPAPAPKRRADYDYNRTYDAGDDWQQVVGAIAAWPAAAQSRHLVMTLALGVALKFGVSESQAVHDLMPIVTDWQTGRDMSAELIRTARWAYGRNQPATVTALRNLGVNVPKLSRPTED